MALDSQKNIYISGALIIDPERKAVDSSNHLYVAESGNNRIVKYTC